MAVKACVRLVKSCKAYRILLSQRYNIINQRLLQLIWFCFLSFCCLVGPGGAQASDLVSVEWLKTHANDPELVVVDLRKTEDYALGHIPNAISLPFSQLTREKNGVKGFVETPKHFKKVIDAKGIKNQHTVVLYGDWSFLQSMRTYWVFDFYGHANILVLDGGLPAWEKQFPGLSRQAKQLKSSNYVMGINPDILTSKFRTYMASKNPDYVIIDARSEKQFDGVESLTARKGHIPNAINLPWHELIDNRNEADELKVINKTSTLNVIDKLQAKLDIIPSDKKIILYCNAGQEASVIYFSLKELGIKSAVYDGSWFEWSEDGQMPVEN